MQSYLLYIRIMRQCIVVFSTERRTEDTRIMHSITIKNRHSHTRALAPTHIRLHTAGRGGGR